MKNRAWPCRHPLWAEIVGDRKRKPRRDSKAVREAYRAKVEARARQKAAEAAARRLWRIFG